MKIKVDIISGFLGAGKTTLIKKLLEEKLYNEKLVIIENEFGRVGIDGSILKKSKAEVKEINSGCICCSLSGDFALAIQEVIKEYKPDRIIIEPSGVGKLSDVIKACEVYSLRQILAVNMVVTVVDVLKYEMYLQNFGEFFENQIESAKTVVFSRTQKADSGKIEAAVRSIQKINPKCSVITTPWERLSAERIISAAEQDMSLALEQEVVKKVVIKRCNHGGACKCGGHDSHSHNHSADEVFDVWGTETPRKYDEKELGEILKDMHKQDCYGMILRGKGILALEDGSWRQFDYVPGEFEIKASEADYTGRICIIGSNLNKEKLSALFEGKN